ncbi:hypothetical protein ACO2Q8_01330 [Larkinella sp. VNQ87]|uniref:hypothetical protein n=1 Tax=Larkinella sp. VNQ87 TaxID=3400921 RepID=UPI003C0A98F5
MNKPFMSGPLGIHWSVCALLCALVAIAYGIFIIHPGKGYAWAAQPFWKYLVLRWFHSLVWVFLALACLIMQTGQPEHVGSAKVVGLLGLGCYLLYLLIFFFEKAKS